MLASDRDGKNDPGTLDLDAFEVIGFVDGSKRWRGRGGQRRYTWDALHGEVEVFNRRGRYLGVLDGRTGRQIKPAVKGRSIDG